MEPLVSLTRIGASLGGQAVLRAIDLELAPGAAIGVVGPNGSGKTTLLRLLATLVAPDQGDGQVLGAILGTPEVYPIRRKIGLVGHQPSLIPELTMAESLQHAITLAGMEPDRGEKALSAVGLAGAAHRRVDASSFGMRRRLELALIVLRRPRLLLLDEPLSGLDDHAVELVHAVVETTRAAGGGVVMVSHESSHLAGCDRIMRLPNGSFEDVG